MQSIDHLDGLPVAGEVYMVPTVRGRWGDSDDEDDWPIFGPVHTDHEAINYGLHHAHVDARFVTVEELCEAMPVVAGLPELAAEVLGGWGRQPFVLPSDPSAPPVYRPMTCQRGDIDAPEFFERRPWFRELCRAVKDKRLGARLACPHQGAPLGSIPRDGNRVRCPLHGLVWDLETGRCVMPDGEAPADCNVMAHP